MRVHVIRKVGKGAWRMPWLSEAMKDVISCEAKSIYHPARIVRCACT